MAPGIRNGNEPTASSVGCCDQCWIQPHVVRGSSDSAKAMRNAMNAVGAANAPNDAMRRLSVATRDTRPSNRNAGTHTNATTHTNTTLNAAVTSVTLCHACSHRPVRACMMDANTAMTPMQVSTEYTQARMIVAMLDLALA